MDFSHPAILDLFPEFLDPKRSDSASFLIWYLENFFRLDHQEAVDSVCDQSGDKGIDGIWVDDQAQTIHVFQSRLSQVNGRTVGDAFLRQFAGTLQQFQDRESVSNLIAAAGNAQVAALARRLNIEDKIADYDVAGEYVTNIETDANGASFLQSAQSITFVGPVFLNANYISDTREVSVPEEAVFDVSLFQVAEYTVDENNKALIAPIKAQDLLKLEGIADQSIFTYNVRGPLGLTNVNKAIRTSIRDRNLHKSFPFFHNGVTIIAGSMDVSQDRLTIADYFVVNGCQSLIAFDKNKQSLSDDLYILAKFIKVDPKSRLATLITEYSNNQNGVKARDFKANNEIQIRLKNEFSDVYANDYVYSVKRGELDDPGVVISNEDAGLYLMAFDLKEPWATHRKYQVFDDKHAELFGRPYVNADRIVMLHIIREEADKVTTAQKEIHCSGNIC